ncbi:MAG: hypothetical protein K0S08_332 [Gammaproteobacteria bacterium]|nr:hypothetical protein [Gammaproteobacteria bacterium]
MKRMSGLYNQHIINASSFLLMESNNHGIFYRLADDTNFNSFYSCAQSLNINSWRNFFQPFACVINNQQANEITLIRDHLGLQPLYYYYQSGKLIFGETIADILKHLLSTPALNEGQVHSLFSDVNFYTDETNYQGIYRVEPGHTVHIDARGKITKKAFWRLESEGEMLHYKNDEDYVEHFSVLMDESIKNATQGHVQIAAEFSAGMDSSAVCCAAFNQGLKPELFMHAASPGTDADIRYKDDYEKHFLQHYGINNLHRIGAEGFDALQVFQEQAKLFAGAPPYIFYMFANNIHRAVAEKGYKILLSGFGGDQGVSGHVPLRHILPSVIKQSGYRAAWQLLQAENSHVKFKYPRQALNLLRYSHPVLHEIFWQTGQAKNKLKNLLGQANVITSHPYFALYFPSLRESEWAFLQGPFSHEVRMRIEYSAIVTKSMGFEYRYPLLYPKLLEFYLSLPPEQKRRYGQGRYLMRRYLAKQLPTKVFDQYKKRDGMDIVPATLSAFEKDYQQGKYMTELTALPCVHLFSKRRAQSMMFNQILAYMLKLAMPDA